MMADQRLGRPVISLVADPETVEALQRAADSIAQTRSVMAHALIRDALGALPKNDQKRKAALLAMVKISS